MAICQECWKPFESDDLEEWICVKCREQIKLTVYI